MGNRWGVGSVQPRMTLAHAEPRFRFHDPETPLAYERLLRAAPRTGRCPVWLGEGAVERVGAWVPVVVPPLDPLGVLQEWGPVERLAAGPAPLRDELVAEAVAWAEHDARRVRLVVGEGRGPAELVATLGWSGAAGVRDLAGLATVLRSWEKRFGAAVVELGADRMTLTVAAPPGSSYEAGRVAVEHAAVCPGLDVDGYRLGDARVWRLRW